MATPGAILSDTEAIETVTSTMPVEVVLPGPPSATRHRLPVERKSITQKFTIANHKGYFTVGLYPNGQPGELFIIMAKEGSTVSGLVGSFAQAISIGLQHGVPIKLFCDKYITTRFEPSGHTGNEEIKFAYSVMDFIFRWLQMRFVPGPHPEIEPPEFGDMALEGRQ